MPARLLGLIVLFVLLPLAFLNFMLINTPLFSDLRPYVITTGSMEPLIAPGSIIYVKSDDTYKKGDPITFSTKSGNIAHRIVQEVKVGSQTYFSTRGDANVMPDIDLVHPSQILGKIEIIVPLAGFMAKFYRSPVGYAAGIVLPLAILYFVLKPRTVFVPLQN